jgi:ribose-phosphate pyrophosphokinase
MMIKINGRPLPTTMFPDNTSQVWHLPADILTATADVEWKFSHEGEFLQLVQMKDLLDLHGVPASLVLSYLPYGRQDKETGNDETFALRSFARLLNGLRFTSVTIHDPHSAVALELIDRSVAVYPKETLYRVFAEVGDLVCYPDHGAYIKYSPLYDLPFISGEKVRCSATGKITSYAVIGNPAGKRVLVVDDICDGGATFQILARSLLARQATAVHLFVSHGLFSAGTRVLFDSGIGRIFTPTGEVGRRSIYS